MSIWIRHLNLSAVEEQALTQQPTISLPLAGLPDLSMMQSPVELRHLLMALHPDAPPETLQRLQDRYWTYGKGLQAEDIIVVPLSHKKVVALAGVNGVYSYDVSSEGDDRHTIPVHWFKKTIPFWRFGREVSVLKADSNPLHEVTDTRLRGIIRAALPYRYNRFAAIKWIIIVIVAWRLFQYVLQQAHGF